MKTLTKLIGHYDGEIGGERRHHQAWKKEDGGPAARCSGLPLAAIAATVPDTRASVPPPTCRNMASMVNS